MNQNPTDSDVMGLNTEIQQRMPTPINTGMGTYLKEKRIYQPIEKTKMLKNIVVISVAFMILFTATGSMANLQSSLNPEEGLGTYSRACGYGAMVLSSLILPTFVIQRYTVKWTLTLSMMGSVISVAAQFYPRFSTMIPAAIISGIFSAPLWSAKCTYITQVGEEYANLASQSADAVISRFFGIFFLIFQTSKIWGNLLATQILSVENGNGTSSRNLSLCGRNFCPSNAHDSSVIIKPEKWQVYILSGIYLGVACVAVIIVALFLDSLERYGETKHDNKTTLRNKLDPLLATFRQMRKPVQIVLIPLTIWSGLEQGFYSADFYQGFVTCAWGIENLGYVGICYGACDAVGAYYSGAIVRYTGRISVFLFGACLNIGVIITLLHWQPDPENPWTFFVIAGIWGVADSIWQTQINAFYGIMFPKNKEAAFSNYRLWESLGFILAFTVADLMCIRTKIYFLIVMLGVGITGYLSVEYSRHKINDLKVVGEPKNST